MQMSRKKQISTLLLILFIFAASLAASYSTSYAFGEGSKGPDVFAVQGMLKSLGFYSGKIDGVYGPKLRSGVKYFQKTYGLTQTGAVNEQTLQSILWAYGNLKIPKEADPQPPSEKQDIPQLSMDEKKMVSLVNQERSKLGLSPLAIDLELARVARIKSKDMIDQDYFSHQSPTYGSPFEMMKKFAVQYRAAAENIACNQNVDKAHEALMQSTGHRENILGKQFTHIGIGIVKGGMCGEMYTQMFISK